MGAARSDREHPGQRHRYTPARAGVVLLGILAALLLLEGALRLGGAVLTWRQERGNRAAGQGAGGRGITVLCLGESTTALGGRDAYPSQLGDVLRERGGGRAFSVINRGILGTDTSVILRELEQNLDRYRPHVVVTMMGANDYGGAVPQEDLPAAERTGWLRRLKTVRLVQLLWFSLGRKDELDARIEALRRGTKKQRAPKTHNDRGDGTRDARAATLLRRARELERLEKNDKAEATLRRAIALDPGSAVAHFSLGRILRKVHRHDEARRSFEQAVRLDPAFSNAHVSLGLCYQALKRYEDARRSLERGLELRPDSRRAIIRMADFYEARGLHAEMERLIGRVGRSEDQHVVGRVARYYRRRGQPARAAPHFRRSHELRMRSVRAMTRDNYRMLHRILQRRGIPLVAVQYPTRGLEPLRRLLGTTVGVTYVDNEASFNAALDRHGYDAIFWDNCYGDFGHCTRRGCRLLAENVARAVLALFPGP